MGAYRNRENIDPLKAIEMEAWELVLMEYFDAANGTAYSETVKAYCEEYNALRGFLAKEERKGE